MRGDKKARFLYQQEPGWEDRYANAAGNPKLARGQAKRHCARMSSLVTSGVGNAFHVSVSGRVRCAFDRLSEAGLKGCTPITEPVPRWSHYIFKMRELAVVSTAGHHALPVLHSNVRLQDPGEGALQVIPKNAREELRVYREPFKGHDLVHFRIWALGMDGEKAPTRKGVSMNVSLAAELVEAVVHELKNGGNDD
jgi:hypothetical protein